MMYTAADSNMNFQHGLFPSSFCNQHVGSFQTGTINSTAGLVQGGINCSGGINTAAGMLAGNPGSLNSGSSLMLEGSSNGDHHLELLAGLKHDTGLAADWSYREQALLSHGLIQYADQPSIMKYIKIAALLPEKSVRDVALRSSWMSRKETGKRRRLDEYSTGRKCKDRKEKIGDSSMNVNIHPFGSNVGYPFMMHHVNNNNHFLSEAPVIDNASRLLLEENAQVLGQIAANLETVKIHDNVNLFLRTRINITKILNSMSGMPGIMSQMPPLPVTISEDLVTSILPSPSQAFIFSSTTGSTVKQEPRSIAFL
ncbi:uncharacterized protein LOC110112682 isoform X1 [Dendrobium catenatum]|uniref:uncharacterized protein LOC110112682 isoform X1 n=1 Tax=Dendrobium catenatum TaxID=906689 RepID=UPI0010A07491|nr:uncharacterized protein LOC110112682 isoform X1 [Dendrobium catenatum]XP_028553118.1 uncharacterized protein LOC110112682 isoform X1 [Dendrobium catenatum]